MIDKTNPEIFKYFDKFAEKNKALVSQFMGRFPFHKSYFQKNLLDFGSGTGCLCFHLAKDCEAITGLDVDEVLYQYSVRKLKTRPQVEKDKIRFINKSIEELESADYDVIFSKDVFEHVENTDYLLEEIYRVLKPGGECLIGFGPLWYSPFGDHGIAKNAFGFSFPWFHLLLGKNNLVRAYNNSQLHQGRFAKKKIADLSKYLNLKSGEEFRNMIKNSNFEIIWYKENVNENFIINIFSNWFLKTRLAKYFIRNIYCILKKPIS